jgi:hypothetical protein
MATLSGRLVSLNVSVASFVRAKVGQQKTVQFETMRTRGADLLSLKRGPTLS